MDTRRIPELIDEAINLENYRKALELSLEGQLLMAKHLFEDGPYPFDTDDYYTQLERLQDKLKQPKQVKSSTQLTEEDTAKALLAQAEEAFALGDLPKVTRIALALANRLEWAEGQVDQCYPDGYGKLVGDSLQLGEAPLWRKYSELLSRLCYELDIEILNTGFIYPWEKE